MMPNSVMWYPWMFVTYYKDGHGSRTENNARVPGSTEEASSGTESPYSSITEEFHGGSNSKGNSKRTIRKPAYLKDYLS